MAHTAGKRPAADRAVAGIGRRWTALLAGSQPDRLVFVALLSFATLVGVLMQAFPDVVSTPTITPPLVMGGLFLGPRPLPWFVIYNLALLTLALPKVPSFSDRSVFTTAVIFLLAFIVMITSFR